MIRQCQECGQSNRVPAARLLAPARCGACKAPLPALAEPLEVDAEQFQEIVGSATVPILVDFWAEWCGPCRAAAPQVAKAARDLAGKAIVLKVNTDDHPQIAEEFAVQSIPNFVVLLDGKIVHQQAGLVDHRQLEGWLEDAGR